MSMHRSKKYLFSLFLTFFLWIGVVGARTLQVGQFYFTTTQEIANKLDPENGGTTFIFRWEIDDNGLSGQLRISTSLNKSAKHVPFSIGSKFTYGELLDVWGTGLNDVPYHFSLSDKDRYDGFSLELAMPGTELYEKTINTVGFVSYIGTDMTVKSSAYYPSKEVYTAMADANIVAQISDLVRQQKDFGVQQYDLSRQQTELTTRSQTLLKKLESMYKYPQDMPTKQISDQPKRKELSQIMEEPVSEQLSTQKELDSINRYKDDITRQQNILLKRQQAVYKKQQELEQGLKDKKQPEKETDEAKGNKKTEEIKMEKRKD